MILWFELAFDLLTCINTLLDININLSTEITELLFRYSFSEAISVSLNRLKSGFFLVRSL